MLWDLAAGHGLNTELFTLGSAHAAGVNCLSRGACGLMLSGAADRALRGWDMGRAAEADDL